MSVAYKSFKQEDPPTPQEPTAPYAPPIAATNPVVTNSLKRAKALKRQQKCRKPLKILSLGQLLASVLILILGIACVVMTSTSYHWNGGCPIGMGIWTGVFMVLANSFAVAACFYMKSRCLTTTYVVLGIISAVFSAGLITGTSIFVYIGEERLDRTHYRLQYLQKTMAYHKSRTTTEGSPSYYYENVQPHDIEEQQDRLVTIRQLLTVEGLILFLAIAHFLSTIVSLVLICYSTGCNCCACCDDNTDQTPTIVYVPATQGAAGQQQVPLIAVAGSTVPQGSHIILMQQPAGTAPGQQLQPFLTGVQLQPGQNAS